MKSHPFSLFPFHLESSSLFPCESKWVQVNPSDIKWVQMSPSESKWTQVISSESKWIQVRSSECKWTQVRSSESNWDPLSPSEIKWVQVSPSETKWVQVKSSETPPRPPILLSNFSWRYRYFNVTWHMFGVFLVYLKHQTYYSKSTFWISSILGSEVSWWVQLIRPEPRRRWASILRLFWGKTHSRSRGVFSWSLSQAPHKILCLIFSGNIYRRYIKIYPMYTNIYNISTKHQAAAAGPAQPLAWAGPAAAWYFVFILYTFLYLLLHPLQGERHGPFNISDIFKYIFIYIYIYIYM